jgi:hypothetical protein
VTKFNHINSLSGGRFDLRLPYAEQGYVDENADIFTKFFGKKGNDVLKEKSENAARVNDKKENSQKNGSSGANDSKQETRKKIWPWKWK